MFPHGDTALNNMNNFGFRIGDFEKEIFEDECIRAGTRPSMVARELLFTWAIQRRIERTRGLREVPRVIAAAFRRGHANFLAELAEEELRALDDAIGDCEHSS